MKVFKLRYTILVINCLNIQMTIAAILLPLNDWCYAWLVSDGTDCSSFYKSRASQMQQLAAFGILANIPIIEGLNKICCKDGTGCFTNALGTPWECYNVLPDCMDKIKPIFYVYTPERPSEQIIDYSNLDKSLNSLVINSTRQLFFEIHGFGKSWPGKRWMIDMKDALIALGNNVILVRWTNGADESNYVKAAANTQTVGAALALVIKGMAQAKKAALSATTIVGFSLGAHVAGYAGSRLTGLKRIIGLDPAGPMFSCQNESARLDPTDANFVQVIHSNGDDLVSGGAGTMQQLGHVDFYANDGKLQPGCNKGVSQAITDIFTIKFASVEDDLACSHSRAVTMLIESIKNSRVSSGCQFSAFSCSNATNWMNGQCFLCAENKICPSVYVGYPTNLESLSRGKYFFSTQALNSGQLCGAQYMISLIANVNVQGNLTLKIPGPDGKVATTILFLSADDRILAGKAKQKIVVVSLKSVTKVRILYNRAKTQKNVEAPQSWTLTKAWITDANGKTIQTANPILVYNDREITIDFK